jgi:hypothetical protein
LVTSLSIRRARGSHTQGPPTTHCRPSRTSPQALPASTPPPHTRRTQHTRLRQFFLFFCFSSPRVIDPESSGTQLRQFF